MILVDGKCLFEEIVRLIGEGDTVGDLGGEKVLAQRQLCAAGDGAEKVGYRLVDEFECCSDLVVPIVVLIPYQQHNSDMRLQAFGGRGRRG